MITNDQARIALEVSVGLGSEPKSTAQVFLAALTGFCTPTNSAFMTDPNAAVERALMAVQRFKELAVLGQKL